MDGSIGFSRLLFVPGLVRASDAWASAATKGRFWLSGVGIGLAFVIPFNTCFAMFVGSFIFWLAGRLFKKEESTAHKVFVQNMEPTCAGLIAGGALMGIGVILLENFVLTP